MLNESPPQSQEKFENAKVYRTCSTESVHMLKCNAAVAILIHLVWDFRAQGNDFYILPCLYVWYFANSSCARSRFGSDE